MNLSWRFASCALPAAGLAAALAVPLPATAAAARPPLKCHASVTSTQPADYTDVGIRVRTVSKARITTAAHYRTTTHVKHGRAAADGRRTIWYYISGATPGFQVTVNVTVKRGSRTGSCSTSFTPQA
jgi:hypothetical protein